MENEMIKQNLRENWNGNDLYKFRAKGKAERELNKWKDMWNLQLW